MVDAVGLGSRNYTRFRAESISWPIIRAGNGWMTVYLHGSSHSIRWLCSFVRRAPSVRGGAAHDGGDDCEVSPSIFVEDGECEMVLRMPGDPVPAERFEDSVPSPSDHVEPSTERCTIDKPLGYALRYNRLLKLFKMAEGPAARISRLSESGAEGRWKSSTERPARIAGDTGARNLTDQCGIAWRDARSDASLPVSCGTTGVGDGDDEDPNHCGIAKSSYMGIYERQLNDGRRRTSGMRWGWSR